ncbi:UbiA family prenyltransferase [Nocardia thraciensis]
MKSGIDISGATAISAKVRRELTLAWGHMQIDLPPTVVAATVYTVASWHMSRQSSVALLHILPQSTVYLVLYCYIHSLANQIAGADEDRENKPFRPIPRGLATKDETIVRFWLVVLFYLAAGISLGLTVWTLVWIGAVLAYNFGSLDRLWCVKNLYPPVGYLVQSVAAWHLGGYTGHLAWFWIWFGVAYWLLVFLQDLRDVAGDELIRRGTLAIKYGQAPVRWAGAIGLTFVALSAWALPQLQSFRHPPMAIWAGTVTMMCLYLGWRFLARRTRGSDNISYQLYAAGSIALELGAFTL